MSGAYLTLATGSFLLLGTLFILAFRKAYIDPETKAPIVFQMPILGKVQTQSPLLLLIAVGAGLALYGASQQVELDKLHFAHFSVTGSIRVVNKGNPSEPLRKQIAVYFIGIPNYEYNQQASSASNTFTTTLPLVPNLNYRARYVADGQLVEDREIKINNGRADVGEFTYEVPAEHSPVITRRIEATDAEKREFGR